MLFSPGAYQRSNMKKLVATLTICTVLAACAGQDRGKTSTPRSEGFEFEGKVVKASKSEKESTTGSSKVGSIALQLSSSHTPKGCALPPPRVVVVPFSANTGFEPMELTAPGNFPESLDGLTLNVKGNYLAGRNCSPMATSVKNVTLTQTETAESIPGPDSGSSPAKGNSSKKAAAPTEPPAPPAPPAADSLLPPLAPVVSDVFRPSLPDPPPAG
jgi:hypothetical protein